jgi:hypothetical protein
VRRAGPPLPPPPAMDRYDRPRHDRPDRDDDHDFIDRARDGVQAWLRGDNRDGRPRPDPSADSGPDAGRYGRDADGTDRYVRDRSGRRFDTFTSSYDDDRSGGADRYGARGYGRDDRGLYASGRPDYGSGPDDGRGPARSGDFGRSFSREGASYRETYGGGPARRGDSHAGRGPSGYRRSADRITEDVNDHLTDDHDVDATDVRVSVENGEVTLEGTVRSRAEKRRAEEIAERVRGVRDVHNRLRITDDTSGSGASHHESQTPGDAVNEVMHAGPYAGSGEGDGGAGPPGGRDRSGDAGATTPAV